MPGYQQEYPRASPRCAGGPPIFRNDSRRARYGQSPPNPQGAATRWAIGERNRPRDEAARQSGQSTIQVWLTTQSDAERTAAGPWPSRAVNWTGTNRLVGPVVRAMRCPPSAITPGRDLVCEIP